MHKATICGIDILDTLCQVPKHTTDGPAQLTIPNDTSICKGCAQEKMTSLSFLNSSSCATELFALIHSNLKTIPVISYHKDKYFSMMLLVMDGSLS